MRPDRCGSWRPAGRSRPGPRRDLGWIRHRSELDKPDGVVVVEERRCGLGGEAGLAGAAGSDQRDQPALVQQFDDAAASSSRPTKLVSVARRLVRRAIRPCRWAEPGRRAGRTGAVSCSSGDGSTPSSSAAARVAAGRRRAPRHVRPRPRSALISAGEPLVERVLARERLELGDDSGRPAEREVGGQPIGRGSEPQIVQPSDRRGGERGVRASASAGPRHRARARRSIGWAAAGSSRRAARPRRPRPAVRIGARRRRRGRRNSR